MSILDWCHGVLNISLNISFNIIRHLPQPFPHHFTWSTDAEGKPWRRFSFRCVPACPVLKAPKRIIILAQLLRDIKEKLKPSLSNSVREIEGLLEGAVAPQPPETSQAWWMELIASSLKTPKKGLKQPLETMKKLVDFNWIHSECKRNHLDPKCCAFLTLYKWYPLNEHFIRNICSSPHSMLLSNQAIVRQQYSV